ncbi:lipopolysaccharide transport periplasmic protein LptA [Thaumasiovibrio sp. DFM-14]|uniref:lipopolysaccharide transport periplasmic protein LptA n=1 Tax=Thaumasiovibrio sp. DFM-14 TaxID=3384792 RepID=UPI0039A16AB5
MNRLSANLPLSALLFSIIFSAPVAALSTDTQQPIYVDADTQELDMANNVVEFKGNVILQQGSIDIRADKIIIERLNNIEGNEVIRSFGKPTTFKQQLDDGTFIHGRGERMVYTTKDEFLQIFDNAYLEQQSSSIEGNTISYRIDKQKLVAESQEGGRVTTVLQPKALDKEE